MPSSHLEPRPSGLVRAVAVAVAICALDNGVAAPAEIPLATEPRAEASSSPSSSPSSPAPPAIAALQLGDLAAAIELDDLAGNRVSLASLRGRPVIVEFFATWCEPCHRAWDDLVAVRAEPQLPASRRPQVVLVDLGESPAAVSRWAALARLDPAVTVALDRNGSAAARWGATRLPTIFVLDREGRVRHINRGWGAGYRDRLRRWLSKIDDSSTDSGSMPQR